MQRMWAITMLFAILTVGCAPYGEGAPWDGGTPPVHGSDSSPWPQTVVYEQVEVRRYSGENGHPYIHSVIGNYTEKTIDHSQFGMLAYDKDGNPLEIDWFSIDTSHEPTFSYLCHWGGDWEIAPGETRDSSGGWSLDVMGTDPEVENIVYVLYCDKTVVFEDGSVWENPHYGDWLALYEGKRVDVADLERYYPYTQVVEWTGSPQ